jgi:hypothetical protein
MSAKGERFAERVKARMRSEGLRTHDDVKEKNGPSSPIMTKVLRAEYEELSPQTARKIETALNLKPGSASISFDDDTDLVPAERVRFVSLSDEDEHQLLYRRPDGITDERWREIVARTRNLVQWEIEQALKDQ